MTSSRFACLLMFAALVGSSCRKPVVGCADPTYENYDPQANEDDGCCCTIVRGRYDYDNIQKHIQSQIPNTPDSIATMPEISLTAEVMRVDQQAIGPCGCLAGWASYGLYSVESSSSLGTFGPRSVCNTSIGWLWGLSPPEIDSIDWYTIAAANGFDALSPILSIRYSLGFLAPDGTEHDTTFTDTLVGYVKYYPNTSTFAFLPYSHLTHRIFGEDLPCDKCPLHADSVTIDVEEVNIF